MKIKDLFEGLKDPQLKTVHDANYYHHATASANLSKIREHGLIGGKLETFDGYDGNSNMVHLSPTLDSSEYWYGMVNFKISGSTKPTDKVSLLRVLKSSVETKSSYRKDEVLAKQVSPDQLEILDGSTWKAL